MKNKYRGTVFIMSRREQKCSRDLLGEFVKTTNLFHCLFCVGFTQRAASDFTFLPRIVVNLAPFKVLIFFLLLSVRLQLMRRALSTDSV